jgi:hypothetical protein
LKVVALLLGLQQDYMDLCCFMESKRNSSKDFPLQEDGLAFRTVTDREKMYSAKRW